MKIYDEYDKNKYIEDIGDFIIAKGGDGTLIKSIHRFDHLNKPFFGIAAGTANFLLNEESKINFQTATTVEFNLLKVEVYYSSPIYNLRGIIESYEDTTQTVYAFNDVNIGEFNGWIDFECTHKENQIGNFKGAGILISTSQGSTGANKNNGGSIMSLNSHQWSVTGTMTNRRIDYVVDPDELTIETKSRGNVKINVDGKHFEADKVTKVVISKSDITVKVIFNDIKKFQEKRR